MRGREDGGTNGVYWLWWYRAKRRLKRRKNGGDNLKEATQVSTYKQHVALIEITTSAAITEDRALA